MPIRFETLAVHGGQHPDPTTLSRGVPVYRTSSYLFKSAEHAAKLFGLAEQGNVYGRLGNPTQAMLEERMSLLEGGVGALASASGTSAIFSTIVNLAKQGDEIVSANNLYGGTFTLFNDILPQFGITTRFVKPQDFDKMEAAVNGGRAPCTWRPSATPRWTSRIWMRYPPSPSGMGCPWLWTRPSPRRICFGLLSMVLIL